MQTLLVTLGHLEQEKHRCERRLRELRELRAWREAQGLHAAARPDRETTGWTDEKRLAVSERMRAYWAKRRSAEGGPPLSANEDKVPSKGKKGGGAQKSWSDEARREAAERMSERWRVRRGGRGRAAPPPQVPT